MKKYAETRRLEKYAEAFLHSETLLKEILTSEANSEKTAASFCPTGPVRIHSNDAVLPGRQEYHRPGAAADAFA